MTSRRSFLAAIAAAVLGRSLFRKTAPPATVVHFLGRHFHHSYAFVPGDGSLFNPRENLAAQWLASSYKSPGDRQRFGE